MAGPWEAYQTDGKPSIKERAATASIERSQAGATASRASAAASGATVEEKSKLLPSRQRKAEADARTAEAKAAQAEIALEKARNLIASMPAPKEVPAAREILLREIRNLAQARELSETMFSASGIGFDMLSGIGGSPAEQVLGLLNPILANEAFEALSKMRAESPTGGALGNVTERELELLKSTGGYVPPTAGDEQFQQGIDDLIKHRIKTLSKLGVFPQDLAAALGPRYVEQFAPEVEGYRFSERDEAALDNYVKQNIPKGTFDPADFAALMGQAYYNATGNQPDENYIKSAFEGGIEIADEKREGLGGLYYEQSDEDTRKRFIGSIGALAPDETTLGEALGGAAINFIPSTFELAGDTVRALTVDLPDTLEGIVDIVAGATGLSEDDTSWEALKDYYVDRYGSYEGFKKALREDPASIAADVAGVFTGGATILAKTAGTAGRVGKIAALSDAARKAEGFSRAVAKIDPLVTATDLTKTGARVAGRAAENIGVALPAKLLGVQTADVKQAVSAGRRGSPEFVEQLTGQGAVTDPIVKAQNAVSELYAQRSKDYQRRMKRLKRSDETLAFDDVEAAIEGVRTVGRHKGVDISSASDVWDKVDAKYMEFFDKGLNSIEDFDAMKRSIANIRDTYQRGTPQYKVANDVVKSINDTIVAKAPIYADIMNDYRMASDTLADVQSSLSLGAKSQDVVLSKLRRNAGGRTPRGTTVLDLLEGTKSGKGLGDTIAAQNLSGTEPSGVAASMGAVGGVTMADPTLMAASATSPRAFGQMAYRAGEGLRLIDKSAEAMAGLPGAQKLGELAQRYAEPAARTLRVANPIIQAQVDPFEGIPEEQKKALIEAYSASAPTFGPAQTDQIRLEDLASTYTGPLLSDATLQGLNKTYEDVDVTGQVIDPRTGLPIEEEEEEVAEGFKRGGAVKGYKGGGPAKKTSWFDDMVMAASRRGNDLVGAAADLADRYGVTPANAAAWIAKNVEGRSPEEVARIRQNLQPLGSNRAVVEAGAQSNERRFRQAGGTGARTSDNTQMPVRLGAAAYKPEAVPAAAVREAPNALRAANQYFQNNTPMGVMQDVGNVARSGYEAVKADPYGSVFNTLLYASPQTILATMPFDYAQMREGSQMLNPYVKDDAEAARMQSIVDAASMLPPLAVVPGAGTVARKGLRKKRR